MKQENSFTLIEILVVIVVIGILSALILVGINSITNSANIARGKAFTNSLRSSLLLNLISEWKFEGNANDSWGGSNATVVGAPTYRSGNDCVSGQCIELNGTSDYLNLASAISLSGEFTVSFWVYRDTNTTYDFVLGESVNNRKIGFYNNSNELFVRLISGGAEDGQHSDDVYINTWNYVVITRDSNNKADSYVNSAKAVRLFDDVAQVGSVAFDRLGSEASNNYHDGRIDNISVYNKIFSASFIQEDYYSGINRLFSNKEFDKTEYTTRLVELKSNTANNE